MARVTVEDCLEQVENRFALVHLASYRARLLRVRKEAPLVQADNKECVLALREVAEGYVKPQHKILDVLEGRVKSRPQRSGRRRR